MHEKKNIVLCLDGTGNQIEENLSNILKLYRTIKKDEHQVVFYDQGVGTLRRTYSWGKTLQKFQELLGLAFGYGLDRNVLQAYKFIVENYVEQRVDRETIRDEIYIFGFSRGAHTARVLAGLIYEVGLLRPEQIHLSGAALMAYKQSAGGEKAGSELNTANPEDEGMNFRRVIRPLTVAIRFMGVFDSVSSVLVPNANGYLPPLIMEKLPHTTKNPAVKCFRHAMAVDERRRMFRVDRWESGQNFQPEVNSTGSPVKQDLKEVWFSGYHSDVGGGHARMDSGLSQIPLIWMLDEAKANGLKVNTRTEKYVTGEMPYTPTTKYLYPKADFEAAAHNQLTLEPWWKILEYIPKKWKYNEWKSKAQWFGWYLPLSEPRSINTHDAVDASVQKRMNSAKINYKPENYP